MSRYFKNVGDWGEGQACYFLERHGFRVVERNYHTTGGEIDIVAVKGGDYYFIEVKTRVEKALANDEAITFFKKRRLQKAMRHYCYHRQIDNISLIFAGVIVNVDKWKGTANFRFVVLY